MRYVLALAVFALQLIHSSSAMAGMVQFSMDFGLRCEPADPACFEPRLRGEFLDAGSFSIDESLLSDSAQTFVPYSALSDFSLSFPAPFFSFDQVRLLDGLCFEAAACGMLFTAGEFTGFVGEYGIANADLNSFFRFNRGEFGGVSLEFMQFVRPGPNGGLQGASFVTDDLAGGSIRIRAATPTPEPVSWLLFMAGGALALRARRRT